ncbi:nuclear exosome regulator NRDE2 isoform X2 [Lasioglossum baleicum]|uniref:nuclear exosome regulator NRDE2 isoform X2 n=1 Tax=Lasioglossum baleicum TaxID=434251 RepID=UPI003FCDD623
MFPAYSIETTDESLASSSKLESLLKGNVSSSSSSNWLRNGSCLDQISSYNFVDFPSESSNEATSEASCSDKQQISHNVISSSKESSMYKESRKHRKHITKRKKEKRKYGTTEKPYYKQEVKNIYFEDKHRDKGNSTVNTLCSRVRPHYSIEKNSLGFRTSYKRQKKDPYQRYYANNIDLVEKHKLKKKSNAITKQSTSGSLKEIGYACSWSINFEELQRTKTKEYNQRLTDDPNNVKLWLEYIQFQDTLEYFEKYQTKKDVHRAATMKKLSIVEKAMEKNVGSDQLLRIKLSLMEELLPADEFSRQLETLVNKDSGDVTLWQGLVMATQASVAMCTVPKVLDLYSKCFCILKEKARTNPRMYDERLLQMLCWCLTFLRHTGLWEQMWETIRLNLSLNLSLKKDSLSFKQTMDEKKLIGMEEVILMSRLPLNQLWQRTESLRENGHWISVSRDELDLTGDSRRFVLPEDVADFVHPILSRNLNFQMAVHMLLLLKVPLLPTRDYVLQMLSLNKFEWSVETSEVLLPFAYPAAGEMTGNNERRELLNGILEGGLTSGPQYLRFHPAQESYLDFIRDTFSTIAENLPTIQRTSIYIWWLRFERLLIFLRKDDSSKCGGGGDNKGKKLRTTLKEFLKKEENRNNLHFYKEYALVEKEMGRFDNCVNILETAIKSQSSCPLLAISDLDERTALFSLYRTFIEILLDTDTYKETHRIRILNVIKQMVVETSGDNQQQQFQHAKTDLENYVKSFMQGIPADDETDTYFLPNLKCDAIVCYAYLLYTEDFDITKEILYESEIAILQLHYKRTQEVNILKSTLNEMLNLYPNNFSALSILACFESNSPIWKFNSQNTKLSLWRAFAMCLANRKRIRFFGELEDSVSMNAAINKLFNFHQTLASEPTTRCCPLLWRLYMLLLREYNLCEKKGEEVYHKSVAQCPWARSIYIDAAEVAPQLLTQIQDVIREKELRMHVTPEELDILRG